MNPQRRYDTSLERMGLALAVGGLLGGAITAALVAAGGAPSVLGLMIAFVTGTIISAMTIVALAGPVWFVCHISGRRGPIMAMLIGGLAGFALFLGGQTYGFGLFAVPPGEAAALLFRWFSGAATSLILALIAALIGLAIWRAGYHRAY